MTAFLLVLLAIVLLGASLNLFTYPLQHHFLLLPDRMAEDHRYEFDHPFEEFFIESERWRVNALKFRFSNGGTRRGVVLYFHGNAGDLRKWGQKHEEFTSLGYDFVVFDYPGFGKSKGRFEEEVVYEIAERMYQRLLGDYAADEIVIFGRSIGSGPATWLASRNPCRQLILDSPYSSIPDLFYIYYPFLPRVFFFRIKFPSKNVYPAVAAPVLILHGTKDRVVPLSCAMKLRPFMKSSDEFVEVPGGKHRDVGDFPEYREAFARWLG